MINPPKEFTGELRSIWDETVKVLDELHRLQQTDAELISVYCYHAFMLRVYRQQLVAEPILRDKSGKAIANPVAGLLSGHVTELRVIADILGLSIKSRKRMKNQEGKKNSDSKERSRLMEFVNRGRK